MPVVMPFSGAFRLFFKNMECVCTAYWAPHLSSSLKSYREAKLGG